MKLLLGTRGSPLARRQAETVAERIRGARPDWTVQIEIVVSEGDRNRTRSLPTFGRRGIFTTAIEERLREGTIDLAVHSLKDLPVGGTEGLGVAAVPERAAPWDVLVTRGGILPMDLPPGGRVGTGSPRRIAQLRELRPDLRFVPLRGNVETRLRQLRLGACDAVVMAEAALARLGLLAGTPHARLQSMVPAPGQGALACQTRRDGPPLDFLEDPEARRCTAIEREILHRLGGGCHSPFGALATREGGACRISLYHLAEGEAAGRKLDLAVPWEDSGRLVERALESLGRA